MAVSVPVYDEVTLETLWADPYPTYARLRAEAPVAWVDAANIHLVTRFDDIMRIERDPETFPALDTRSLQVRAMGHTMMRRDGADHLRQRRAVEATFLPQVVAAHWGPLFEAIADDLIGGLKGGRADLFAEFAAPLASRSLMALLGLPQIDWRDLCLWSQALMDATGNYGDDSATWARGKAAFDAIDAAIAERVPVVQARPDPSALSSMLHGGLPMEEIRANTKVIVGGGLNEPRDATCSAVLGLLTHPGQLAQVQADPTLWKTVFEETVRWIAPIGLYPRRVARQVEIGGAVLEAGDAVGLSVASACHDESRFEGPERFDINRAKGKHLAFGAGPHFCLGAWMARRLVGEIALPRLFARLPGLRLDPDAPPEVGGWVFRGPVRLPVLWDA
ncbi:MAG: cytochrome P450 [Pseudooceanicola sp.]|nr:cytochrome P450 [Pseudooceanicola sp.]